MNLWILLSALTPSLLSTGKKAVFSGAAVII
jgi:hypothetical protein